MKRISLILTIVLALMFAMVGGVGAQEQTPVVLTFFTTEADPPQLEALASVIDEFNAANPYIFVDVVTGTPSTRGNRMTTLVTAGVDAGIFEIEPAFASAWAEAGYLLPLDDVYEANGGADNYVEGSVFFNKGTAYALPYATSVYGIWYRTDIFEAAGITAPTNYAELIAAAEALTDPANGQYGLSIPGATNASVNYFSTFLWQNCMDYYTPQGELIFDRPEALEAVQNWATLANYAPPGFEGWSYGDQITAFITEQAAMSMYAGRMGARMPDQAPQLEAISSLIQLPWQYGERGAYVTFGNWSRIAISANSAHPEEAKAFLQFFLSGDRLARYDATVIGHMVPPLNDVGDLLENWDSEYAKNHSDWLTFFNENAAYINHPANNMGSVNPTDCSFNPVQYGPPWGGPIFSTGGIIDVMFQEIFVGGRSPEDAWNNAVSQMREVQDSWLADHPDWAAPQQD